MDRNACERIMCCINCPQNLDEKFSFESKWLRDCPNDFKHVFYRRYIDDIFVLFSSPDHADKFREYLPFKNPT